MLIKTNIPSAFLTKKHFKAVTRDAGLEGLQRSMWYKFHEINDSPLRMRGVRVNRLIGLSITLNMTIEALERAIVKRLEGSRKLTGFRCPDCVVAHPVAVSYAVRALMNLQLKKGL